MYYDIDDRPLKERIEEKETVMLQEIKKLILGKSVSPTVKEIKRATGMNSTSTTLQYMRRLQKKGYIDWEPKKPRTLRLINKSSAD